MKLELRNINIRDIQLGDETSVKDGVLTVSTVDLTNKLKEDQRVKEVKLDIAKIGRASCRERV